jgi:hypothetical protein
LPETPGEPVQPADPAVGELESIRSTARWLVAAAAAIATALLAGLQVSSGLSKVVSLPWRLLVATGASLVGVSLVLIILILAARVLVAPGWTPDKLSHLSFPDPQKWATHWLRAELDAQRALLVPTAALEPDKLYRHQMNAFRAWFTFHESGKAELVEEISGTGAIGVYDATITGDEDRLRRRLDNISAVTARVCAAANLADTRRRYRLLVHAVKFSPLIAVAVGTFTWATTTEAPIAVSAPFTATVRFTDDQGALNKAGVSTSCAGRTLKATVVGGTLLEPVVVSITDTHCQLRQARLTSGVAIVVPDVPTK